MHTHDILSAVAVLDEHDQPVSLAGTAFPISPDGGFVTCLHVVSRVNADGTQVRVGVIDGNRRRVWPVEQHFSPSRETGLDMAYLPSAIGRPTPCFLPILSPEHVMMGSDANMLGYYVGKLGFEIGSFHGNAVATPQEDGRQRVRLPYAVIEGCSGAPLLTYHNGTKVAGMAFGSESQRILAYEIADVVDGESR